MPEPAEILLGLGEIANRGLAVAVVWHVVLAAALVGLARGWRPAQRTAQMLISAPLISVAAFSFAFGNPFNGAVFAAGALAPTVLARTSEPLPVSRGPSWAIDAGLAMIAFGWVYPHFLHAHPAVYLVAAPVGLLPCPTLAVAIGFALLGGGRAARAWSLTLAGLGLFYGVFGAFRLGVWLDLGLVVGAIALAATVMPARLGVPRPPTKRRPLLWYFALAFGISWTGVAFAAAHGSVYVMFVAMLLGPTLASLGLTSAFDGTDGLRALGRRLATFRIDGRWATSLLVAPALLLVVLSALSLLSRNYRPGLVAGAAPGMVLTYALIAGLGAGFFEELGWTGFATPRLLRRHSWVASGAVLGLLWAVWHAFPDYLNTASTFGSLWSLHIVEWLAALVAFRVFMTWVYSRKGSLVLGMLLHASFTGSQALLWPSGASPRAELIWYGLFACGLWLVVAVIVLVTNPRAGGAPQAMSP